MALPAKRTTSILVMLLSRYVSADTLRHKQQRVQCEEEQMKRTLMVFLLIGGAFAISLCGMSREVVLNEVAWAGNASDPTGEWIELYNTTDHIVDLSGWRLVSSDGAPNITLAGTIASQGYLVLYRLGAKGGDIAGRIYYSGALRDGGESLHLINSAGSEVDSANSQGGPWPAGKVSDVPCTMERIDSQGSDTPDNWANAHNLSDNGLFFGTPGERNSVSYTPPQATFSFTPDPAHPDKPVLFTANASLDVSSKIASYVWDFGDEAVGRGQTFSHTYVQTGSYSVLLTLRDSHGGDSHVVKNIRVIVNALPRVDFSVRSTANKRILQSLDPLQFIDESYDPDGKILAWAWNFGDGTMSTEQTPSHTYIGCGTYIVRLDVTDNDREHAYQTQSWKIESIAPVAWFIPSPERPNVGDKVTFDATASFDRDGMIVEYDWDVGDDGSVDATTSLPLVRFSFQEGGAQIVSLQVVDDCGVASLPYLGHVTVNYPPAAAFQVSNFYPKQAEVIQFTDQSHDDDGSIASWEWEFGDGSSSSKRSPQHSYVDNGAYLVTLTVSDDNGSQTAISSQITVANIPPTAHLTVNGNEGKNDVKTSETVIFDGSMSHDDRNPARTGKIVSYQWDLDGNGTYEEETDCPRITHSYPDNGTYKVRLQVTDDEGATGLSNQVTIIVHNRQPSARFTTSPNAPTDADEVLFTDASSDSDGTISSWKWSFGDGTSSNEHNPCHSFIDDGTYEISLIVTDNDGAQSTPYTRQITVANAAPLAEFDIPIGASAGNPVTFNDRSYDPSRSGEIVHVAWDFGDGTFCPGSVAGCDGGDVHNPVHTYAVAGTYTVSLVVIDDDGALDTVTHTLTISE